MQDESDQVSAFSAPAPGAQGLYDPQHEHDACGVGFVVHLQGRALARDRRARRSQLLRNLEHRGACGCEANTGDGAGILVQMPDRFLRKVTAPLGITLPAGRARTAPASSSCRTTPRERAAIDGALRGDHRARKGRPSSAGATCRPTTRLLGDSARRAAAGLRAGLHRPRRRRLRRRPSRSRFERKLYVIRKRVEHGRRARSAPSARCFYVVSLSAQTLIYKGMLTARPARRRCSRTCAIRISSRRWRWSTSASAPTRSRPGRWRTRTA